MIHKGAGVSKATLYAKFPNKEALFARVIGQECALLTEQVLAIEGISGDFSGTLRKVGRTYLEILLSPRSLALFRTILSDARRFPELGTIFYRSGPKVINEKMAELVAEAVETGVIDVQAIGVPNAAKMFVNMLRSEGQLESLVQPDSRPSEGQLDHWVETAVTTFMLAFGRRDTGTQP